VSLIEALTKLYVAIMVTKVKKKVLQIAHNGSIENPITNKVLAMS